MAQQFESSIDQLLDEAIAHRNECDAQQGTCGRTYVCDIMAMYNRQMLEMFYEHKAECRLAECDQ